MRHDDEQAPSAPAISPQLAAAVSEALETLMLASPRSPRAVEARNNPDRYVEMYARAILGAPLAAIPVAVTRLTQTEELFPSVPRFVSEVRSVAKQYFPSSSSIGVRRDERRAQCCGSEWDYYEFEDPTIIVRDPDNPDDKGKPHRFGRILCDCEVERRVRRGLVLLNGRAGGQRAA